MERRPIGVWPVRILLVVFALLPVQWVVLASLQGPRSLSLRPAHIAAFPLVLITFLTLRRGLAKVLIRYWAFSFVALGYVLTLTIAAWYKEQLPTSALHQLAYAVVALCVAAIIATCDLSLLRWSAFASLATFSLWFSWGFLKVGENPIAVLVRTATSADSLGLQGLYQRGFVLGGLAEELAAAPLRHDIFASLLLTLWVAQFAKSVTKPNEGFSRFLIGSAFLGTVLLIFASLSRAIILALLVAAMLPLLRLVFSGTLSPRHGWILPAVASVLIVITVSPIGTLLWDRFFSETVSYSSREQTFGIALSVIREAPLTGGEAPTAHSIVLDSWVYAGLAGGILGLALLGSVVVLLLKLLKEYLAAKTDPWSLPLLGLGFLALVWMNTMGGGVLNLPCWIGLGVLGGSSFQRAADQGNKPSLTAQEAPAHRIGQTRSASVPL